jgi:hypothetical protein
LVIWLQLAVFLPVAHARKPTSSDIACQMQSDTTHQRRTSCSESDSCTWRSCGPAWRNSVTL